MDEFMLVSKMLYPDDIPEGQIHYIYENNKYRIWIDVNIFHGKENLDAGTVLGIDSKEEGGINIHAHIYPTGMLINDGSPLISFGPDIFHTIYYKYIPDGDTTSAYGRAKQDLLAIDGLIRREFPGYGLIWKEGDVYSEERREQWKKTMQEHMDAMDAHMDEQKPWELCAPPIPLPIEH